MRSTQQRSCCIWCSPFLHHLIWVVKSHHVQNRAILGGEEPPNRIHCGQKPRTKSLVKNHTFSVLQQSALQLAVVKKATPNIFWSLYCWRFASPWWRSAIHITEASKMASIAVCYRQFSTFYKFSLSQPLQLYFHTILSLQNAFIALNIGFFCFLKAYCSRKSRQENCFGKVRNLLIVWIDNHNSFNNSSSSD